MKGNSHPSMDMPPDTSPCLESISGLGNRIVVVNQGDIDIAPELLQKIADENNVPVSDLLVLTKEMYDMVMRNATPHLQLPDPTILDELCIRDYLKVPELSLLPFDRNDSRPWYNKFDNKRRRRR